jgi:hypothetical protein
MIRFPYFGGMPEGRGGYCDSFYYQKKNTLSCPTTPPCLARHPLCPIPRLNHPALRAPLQRRGIWRARIWRGIWRARIWRIIWRARICRIIWRSNYSLIEKMINFAPCNFEKYIMLDIIKEYKISGEQFCMQGTTLNIV